MAEAEEFAERKRQEFRSRLISGGRIDDSIHGVTWPEDEDPIRKGETVEDAVRRILKAREHRENG